VKRIGFIAFYWGRTKVLKLKMDAPSAEWKMELYGFSIKNTFVGVMVKGSRITPVEM
jgi:hypothetical protein